MNNAVQHLSKGPIRVRVVVLGPGTPNRIRPESRFFGDLDSDSDLPVGDSDFDSDLEVQDSDLDSPLGTRPQVACCRAGV